MKIGQYKMANEWMREESATPEEALNTWNELEAEFKANRAMSQEPRSMDLAALSDDVVPGRLKDELAGNFDPSQETYEEYLQRINLERPFNMNQGGRIGFYEGKQVKIGKRKGEWVIYNVPESVSKSRSKYFPDETAMNKWIESRPGKGRKDFGKHVTGALHKGKIRPVNQEKLNKLIEIINESNNSYKKTITSKDALIKAGWKDGYQSIGTTQSIRPAVVNALSKLNNTFQKMDNYVNNVMLAENALVKDFEAPMKHLQKKFGVSRGTLDNWANGNPQGTWKGSKVYKDNKELFYGLRNKLSFNKYAYYADGTPRLMSDYSVIQQNKMPSSKVTFFGDAPTNFVLESAKRNYMQMKAAGLEPKVTFISDPAITAMSDWQFIDNETGKLFSVDPSIDTVEFEGQTYKNNYLQHKDARKLYNKEFGNLYKVYDEDLAKYLDADSTIIGKNGKPIKLDTILKQQAFEKSKTKKNPKGKKDYLRRRFMEVDHADLWNDPFGRNKGGLRLIDRIANQKAGIYKQIYKDKPELLKSKLDEIGYSKKFNNTNELIQFYSDRATGKRITAKNFLRNIPKGEAGFMSTELAKDIARGTGKGIRIAGKWFGIPDAIFYYIDKQNMLSKGMPEAEAQELALKNATFGLYKRNNEYMKGLKKTAESMGIDSKAFDDIYKVNVAGAKFDKYYVKAKEEIKNLKELGYDKKADDAQKNLDRYVEEQYKNLTNLNQKVTDQISISKAGGAASPLQLSKATDALTKEDYYKPFKDITKVAKEKLKQEKRSVFSDIKRKVNPAEGKWGTRVFDTLDFIGQGVKNIALGSINPALMDLSERQKKAKYLREANLSDLNLINKARGLTYDQPITEDDISDLQYNYPGVFFSKGGRASHMGEGIASIRRPKAIPPKAGPMPDASGLSTLYNRVKRI